MRNTSFKFSIAALTFSIGLGVFNLSNFQSAIKDEQDSNIAVIEFVKPNKQDLLDEIDPWKLPDNFPPLKKGDFFPVGHACGNGYVDGWLAYDGSRLS